MQQNHSSKSGFVRPRNLFGLLLVTLGLSFAVLSVGASGTAKSSITKGQASITAANPTSGTLDPAHPTLTYTDGPLPPNPSGILGAPVCNGGICSDFTVTVNGSSL